MSTQGAGPRIEIERLGGVTVVTLSGVIDESFSVASLLGVPADQPVVFDLDAVERITSFGVREWMNALATLPCDEYYFVRCRPMIVAQFNSVTAFGRRGILLSLYCPYLCPSCEHAFDVLADLRRDHAQLVSHVAPETRCPRCNATAEFDDLESAYFACIPAQRPNVSQRVLAYLEEGQGVRRAFHLEKVVEDDLTGLWLEGDIDRRTRIKRYIAGLEGRVVVVLERARLAEPEGVARLEELWQAEGVEVFVARVPLSLAVELLGTPLGFGLARAISLVTDGSCSACSARLTAELAASGEVRDTRCPSCGATMIPALAPPLDSSTKALLHTLPGVEAPPEISSFIARHASAERRAEPPRTSIHAGTRIGRYEVVRSIGMGGMAEVLLGRQLGMQGFEKKVVIKRILPHLAVRESFVQMFLQEARVAARLQHPNVAQIYDLGRFNDDYFIVMELVRGGDLNQVIKLSRALDRPAPQGLAARIVADLCAGLTAAHTHKDDEGNLTPILHRDVSPHNVLIGVNGAVKITDFGVAKAHNTESQTKTGTLKGKLIYMAPEHVRGEPADALGDVYAAGLALYACLTGVNPFYRANEASSLLAIMNETPPRVRELRPDVDEELEEITSRGMARDPKQRFQSAEAFQLELERYLQRGTHPATASALGRWLQELVDEGKRQNLVSLEVPSVTPSANDDVTTLTTPLRTIEDATLEPSSQPRPKVNFTLGD